jgi:methylenetetrahydrofolate reductase (NADPH)
MMDVRELFSRGKPVFSFEFFLPKAPEDIEGFLANVRELKRLEPAFVTLTYGAGGSGREKTIDTAGRLKKEVGVETACHLTCVSHTRAEIRAILDRVEAHGIRHIVALRGDVPKDGTAKPVEQRELPYARDLVELISRRGGFQIAVAGYPETHPEARSPEKDLENLALKVAAGGDWVVTQLFFDNRDYFKFVERARAIGVKVPIVPGIMPVTGYNQLKRFTQLCGAKLPREMTEQLENIQHDPEAVVRFGVEWAARQCRELLERGAPGVHFYTLNKSRSTAEILAILRKGL